MNVTVRRGDNLWKIAQENHVDFTALKAANPQIKDKSLIHAGDRVHLPGNGDTFEAPKTPSGGKGWQAKALAHPNDVFKQQFKSKFNPHGPPRSKDCGPASLAMAIQAFGLEPKGLHIDESIDHARELMTGNTDNVPTGTAQMRHGARAAGLHAEAISLEHLDEALAAGHMVVAVGCPNDEEGKAYRDQFKRYPEFEGKHAILVLGKTAAGNYVVNDPCSRKGSVELTRAQMHAYWAGGGGEGTAVWR